ncbi:methyltransferase domain-containing protein [Shimazuella kribbensis]|uniref:methyltransferase domain-containing protein n=1 Tax=Shimazuella kribbensis TaxID=139808 RepID=UPI000416FAF1|nr:methyltransferase domain-containing protein [Shimazuella kribbensis]
MKVIYPPTIHWEGSLVFQRPQQLMKAFAKAGHRAVFMEYGRYDGTVYFRDGVEISDCRSILPKAEESTVLWVSHPPYYRFTDRLHADLLVFDYIDEAAEEFAIWNNQDLKKAMEAADVITVVSQRLYDLVAKLFPEKHILLIPNAADFEHFCDAKKMPIPSDMQHIPKPILGFMGSIASWIDVSILTEVAKLRPDWSIVLLGNDYLGIEGMIADCLNVFFLGRKLYHELPPYVGQFAVGLVPFQVRDMTHSSSPIKMYEYLAAGIPVISTPIQEAIECPYVATGATATEWIQKTEELMTQNPDELQSFAFKESWETRVKQVEPILTELAKEKQIKKVLRQQSFSSTTPTYWDIRFLTDWENLSGREQTAFFANVVVNHLPEEVRSKIENNHYSLCDAGCALGDAVNFYSHAFPNSSIEGIDFSTEAIIKANRYYSDLSFEIQSIENMTKNYDVIFCSNVLALYADPISPFIQMAKKANHYIVLLLPFQNGEGTQENQCVFTFDSFPQSLNQFELISLEEIDCIKIPQAYCQSKQILVIYKSNQE